MKWREREREGEGWRKEGVREGVREGGIVKQSD